MEKELHEKMKFAWKFMKKLKEDLKFETTNLECSFGNYVKVNNKWKKQNYPIPTFLVKDIGEVGYDFDTFYLVIGIEKISVNEKFIEELLKTEYNISIYGNKNFLKDLFYSKSRRDL